MNKKTIARRAMIGAFFLLPACSATKAVTDPIESAASGFADTLGLLPADAKAESELPASGFKVVQSRDRFRNPRNDREALEQLRARRQELQKQSR